MKRIFTVLVLLFPLSALAQTEQASLVRNGKQMEVAADFQLDAELVRGIKALALMPRIVGEADTLNLKPVGLYLKDKHYHFLSGLGVTEGDAVYGKQDLPATMHYATAVPFARWMDDSKLELVTLYEGCCGDGGVERVDSLAAYQRPPIQYHPAYLNAPAPAQVKARSLSGEGSVIFSVGNNRINPKLRDNAAMLEEIRTAIETVRATPDVTIRGIVLQGGASPEGRYAFNEKLAAARADAIRTYLTKQLDLPEEIFQTDFVAEDWAGLRAYVAASELADKEDILAIIDSDQEPDAKEQAIRSKHAASWRTISTECLPELRRVRYCIDYEIAGYEEPKDILAVMETAPENLTLAEFYAAAGQYKPGTAEHTRICRAALAQFPDDPVANLNAANAEMAAGNYAAAKPLLAKAGSSAEAEYARGVFEASQEHYEAAVPHFRKALDGGIRQAAPILEEIDR